MGYLALSNQSQVENRKFSLIALYSVAIALSAIWRLVGFLSSRGLYDYNDKNTMVIAIDCLLLVLSSFLMSFDLPDTANVIFYLVLTLFGRSATASVFQFCDVEDTVLYNFAHLGLVYITRSMQPTMGSQDLTNYSMHMMWISLLLNADGVVYFDTVELSIFLLPLIGAYWETHTFQSTLFDTLQEKFALNNRYFYVLLQFVPVLLAHYAAPRIFLRVSVHDRISGNISEEQRKVEYYLQSLVFSTIEYTEAILGYHAFSCNVAAS